jgi:hypothetical protein
VGLEGTFSELNKTEGGREQQLVANQVSCSAMSDRAGASL